jgi:hypothetical protein
MPRTNADNLWLAKARALDGYRWALLRERYSLLGSAIRFAREALSDLWFGLQARLRLAGVVNGEPCDFLLLQAAPKVIAFQRKKLLIESLRGHGYTLVETALHERRQICAQRLFKQPAQRVPLRYLGYAAHAEWLVARHLPTVLLNDRNGSLYAPFLRLALNERQSPLVHLAHATTVETSRRLSMNDYDYYMIFGRSSLEALQARALRFGTSTVLLAGSHMIDRSFDLAPVTSTLRTLLILGVGPDKEKEAGYQRTYNLLRDWAQQNPQYQVLVKRHPRSSVPFWCDVATELSNVSVLPAECSLAQALEKASLVVNIMSNAVIEAGLAARPVIYCNLGSDADIFSQQRFFGPAVTSLGELQARVSTIESAYGEYVEQSRAFAHYHLTYGVQGLERTVQVLQCLQARKPLPSSIEQCLLPSLL